MRMFLICILPVLNFWLSSEKIALMMKVFIFVCVVIIIFFSLFESWHIILFFQSVSNNDILIMNSSSSNLFQHIFSFSCIWTISLLHRSCTFKQYLSVWSVTSHLKQSSKYSLLKNDADAFFEHLIRKYSDFFLSNFLQQSIDYQYESFELSCKIVNTLIWFIKLFLRNVVF